MNNSAVRTKRNDQQQESKMEAIIARKRELPEKIRTSVDEAVRDNLRSLDFLSKIENKLIQLLWENWNIQGEIDESKGLNRDRDTEAQVEAAIRFFPKVLSTKHKDHIYPIWAQIATRDNKCNLKAASFVPLLAKLGGELGLFEDGKRGGLLSVKHSGPINMLESLSTGQPNRAYHNAEHLRLVDETYLDVLKRLRQMRLFKKEDIAFYHLIHRNVAYGYGFFEQQFRYLMEWDSSSFMLCRWGGCLPIHTATCAYYLYQSNSNEKFLKIFNTGLQYFPTEMGGLFHLGSYVMTPWNRIDGGHRQELLATVFNRHNNNVNLLLESLIYASSEELVHLDAVFLLLQRILEIEPSIVSNIKS